MDWRLLLEPECPLYNPKKTYVTVYEEKNIFVMGPDTDLNPDWIQILQQSGVRIRFRTAKCPYLDTVNLDPKHCFDIGQFNITN